MVRVNQEHKEYSFYGTGYKTNLNVVNFVFLAFGTPFTSSYYSSFIGGVSGSFVPGGQRVGSRSLE